MNSVVLMGRLTADPDVRSTNAGKTVASYRLAVDRQYKQDGQPSADFISCVAFGSNGDFASKYLHKGMKIAVKGHIQTGSFEKDGVKHYKTDVIVDRQEFCEPKASGSAYQPQAEPNEADLLGFTDIQSDDIPF